MNTFRWLLIFLLIFIFISPASQADETIPRASGVRLGVGFSWEGITECSDSSPEIKVTNSPRETWYFRVMLDDLDDPSAYHGGGKVEKDYSGIIPAGALKKDYKGPCPYGETHRYQFTVYALDSASRTIGKGKATRLFP